MSSAPGNSADSVTPATAATSSDASVTGAGSGSSGFASYGRRAWTPGWLKDRPRPLLYAVRSVLIVFLAIFLIWLVLFVTKGRFLKGPFESYVSGSSGREVSVNGDFQLYFAPFDIKFLAEDMSIDNPPWITDRKFLTADRIEMRVSPLSLLFGKTRIDTLALDNAALDFQFDTGRTRNNWTFGDPDTPSDFTMPLIRRARIAGTTVRFIDPLLQIRTDIAVQTVKATDSDFDSDVRFSGTGTIRRKPMRLTGSLLSPDATLAGGKNKLAATMTSAGTRIDVSGTLPGFTVLEGADLKTKTTGPDMADLFDFLGVAVPPSRTYRLTSDLTYQDSEWRFTSLNGIVGESDLSGRITASFPDNRLYLDADLRTKTLDIVDIGPIIGYDPAKLEAQGNQGLVRTVGGRPTVLPDAPLRTEALGRFDARIRYRAANIRAESFPVSNVDLLMTLDHNLMKLKPAKANLAGGNLVAYVTIDARKPAVQTEYDISLSPTPMGRLLAKFGVEQNGTTGTIKGRVQLKGTGDSLRESLSTSRGRIAFIMPQGTIITGNAQLAELDVGTFAQKMFEGKLDKPVRLNCGLIGFTVRDGIAAADPILLDTTKNVIVGRGGFSFRTEALDMAMRADGKKFSLFSGQSPVGVGGYFAEPSIDPISGQLLGRAGAGIGLAIVATPLAGILAFVDVGDAKSTACGPVLSGARAAAQKTTKGEKRDDVGRGTTAKDEDGKASPQEKKAQRDKLLKGENPKKEKKKFLGIF